MATSTQEWIDELKGISVLELSERIKAGEEESSAVDVVLTGSGDKKIGVIKVVRAATGLGLKEAKALVDEAPKPVKEGVEREEAESLLKEIEEAGGTGELK